MWSLRRVAGMLVIVLFGHHEDIGLCFEKEFPVVVSGVRVDS